MKIVRAERAGMCMGVNLALSKLDALIARMDAATRLPLYPRLDHS